jgi:hypothetical protein
MLLNDTIKLKIKAYNSPGFGPVATRYDRHAVNFLAVVCIAATVSYW